MDKILVVVDMQNDFVYGSLGTPEARAIVPRVAEKIRACRHTHDVVFTLDMHGPGYLDTEEGKNLPVLHCLSKSQGANLVDAIGEAAGDPPTDRPYKVFEKGTYGSVTLGEYLQKRHQQEPVAEVEFVGVCTDICVVSNALLAKAFLPNVHLAADAACCAGVTPAKHNAALEVLRSCHIEVRNA